MADEIKVFLPAPQIIPIDELYEILAHDNVYTQTDESGHITQQRVVWSDSDTVVTLTFVPSDDVPEQIDALIEQLDAWFGHRDDRRAQKVMRRAEGMVQIVRVRVDPDWDNDAAHLVLGLMDYYDYGFFYGSGGLYNENGKRLIGEEDSPGKYFDTDEEELASKAARDRKQRSIKRLKTESVPLIEHLPVIPDEDETTPRTLEQTLQRAIVIYIMAAYAHGQPRQWVQDRLAQYHLPDDALSPEEAMYLQDDEPPDYIQEKYERRYEILWVLLWAVGYVDALGRPDTRIDTGQVAQMQNIIDTRSWQTLLMDATMRDVTTLLDAADLTYRYHWAVVDADLYGKPPPAGLKPMVVYERHYALNWLIRLQDADWDDVTTDT